VEVLQDTIGYTAKSNSGGGNFVKYSFRLTDYANITEKVYRGSTLVDSLSNNQALTPGAHFTVWNVGTRDSGTYRFEITANSQYGDASDVKNFTIFVDTTGRNNAPTIAQIPRYVHDWNCLFPTDPNHNYDPQKIGGDWIVAKATDLDGDVLNYCWTPDEGFVGPLPYLTGSTPSCGDDYDSLYYRVPDDYVPLKGASPVEPSCLQCEPGTTCTCIRVDITDPAGNQQQAMLKILPACRKGDLDASGSYSPTDVVLGLTAVFLGQAPEPYGDYVAIADINCSGSLTAADTVYLLMIIFLGAAAPC
jgi:hypothetical protein